MQIPFISKTMSRNKNYLLFLIIPLILFSSCESTKVDDTKGQEEQIKLRMSVHINEQSTHNVIDKFNAKNSNIKIVIDDIPQNISSEYSEKLTAKLMAGDGPDIFCNNTNIFPSIYKAIQNGIFCNLDKLIKEDKEFKLKNYYEEVLNCGVIDGKRYILPINFDVHIFYGFEKVLKNNNIFIDDNGFSWDSISKLSRQFMDKNKGKYFFMPMDFGTIFESSGKSFIDYKSKKANFDSEEFINLLKTYKEIIPAICPTEYAMKYNDMCWGMAKDNLLVLQQSYYTNPEFFWTEFNFGKNVLNSDMKIYPYPSYEGNDKSAAYVENFIAINNNCKYKEEAFKFIKFVLSKDIQKNTEIPSAPVNIDTYKEIISDYAGKYDGGDDLKSPAGDKAYKSVPIPKELAKSLEAIPEKVKACNFVDKSVLKIINDEMTKFLNGDKSAEQTAKAINEKVSLFLNE